MNGTSSGEAAGEVVLIADELSRAVELILNPVVSQEDRSQAYNACESFKENSPWCAQAGLLLASGTQYSAVVKHFGLQLMETTVKYRWTQISQAEKIFIKENAMKLLYMGGWETGHLNDALARVIVEMIKREWPQQWPTLLAELSDACGRGHVHTQIVLHVFLRLVEDVATLQTLEQHQRRKDIYQALTSNMAEIFAFFMRLIELHVQEFREKTSAGDFPAANSNGRVVQVVLQTLTGFVEWVSMNHVVMNNGRLLQILCILLQDESFQIPAAECLLQVVNRKGSTKERKPLMILFSEDAISCIYRAALAAINVIDEHHYNFLKKLSQVLAGLGQQLSTLWSCATNHDSWLPVLLETLLVLTSHPSLTLTHTINSVWLAFYKHDQISKLSQVVSVIPRWLQATAPKVLKVSYPTSRVSGANDAVAFACLDYDSEQDFAIFFLRCRTEILDSYRNCMVVAPLVTWSYIEQWTQSALDKAAGSPADVTPLHPLYIEWEALSLVLDVILSRLLVASPRPDVVQGLRILQRCVSVEPAAPLLTSLLLSFISALFVFLSCASCQLAGPSVGSAGAELLPRVLDKIFAALVYQSADPEMRDSRSVKNVRRHASGLLVKLASKYPLLLLPVFNRLHTASIAVISRPELSALASVTLQEALLLVANHFCNYERQSALVAQVLGDCRSRWEVLSPHLSSASGLSVLVGLGSEPGESRHSNSEARRTLIHALTLLLGVVKRSQVPDDPDKASRGGFSAGVTPSGNPIWRNPCGVHVLPLLPQVLALARTLHDLHAPTSKGLIHPGLSKVLELPIAEQQNLLGLRDNNDCSAITPQDRMQNYMHTLHDNVCHLIGAAAGTLGRELYSVGGLARALQDSILHGLQHLPDHRLRALVRGAIRPLIHHCPPAHFADVAVPVLEHFAPFMLQHLSTRWEYISSLYETGRLEETGGSDAQEVLSDILLRVLTREYLELLKIALVGGSVSGEAGAGEMEEDSPPPARSPDHISELGALLLDSAAGPVAFHTIFVALTWGDTTSSLRACVPAPAVLRGWAARPRARSPDAHGALAAVLRALRTHGQHDANQAALLALAVQTYETLRPQFPSVANVLRSIPDVDARDLLRLDEKSAVPAPAQAKHNKIDKSKRELFKKITTPLIGRSVGQLFKKEIFIVDLPSMPAKEKSRGSGSPPAIGLDQLFNSNAPT